MYVQTHVLGNFISLGVNFPSSKSIARDCPIQLPFPDFSQESLSWEFMIELTSLVYLRTAKEQPQSWREVSIYDF